MKRREFLHAVAATLAFPAGPAPAQQEVFLWGRASWQGSIPAVSVEVGLWWNGRHASTTFTDDAGYYAFYTPPPGFPTDPQAYELRFRLASGRVQNRIVPNGTMSGGEIPPMLLF